MSTALVRHSAHAATRTTSRRCTRAIGTQTFKARPPALHHTLASAAATSLLPSLTPALHCSPFTRPTRRFSPTAASSSPSSRTPVGFSSSTVGSLDVGFCCGFHRADYLRKQAAAASAQMGTLNKAASTLGFSTASSSSSPLSDPVFSVDSNSLRYGRGALDELGAAAKSLGLHRVMLFTDRNIRETAVFARALSSLRDQSIDVVIFDAVSIEPTMLSVEAAARAAAEAKVDGCISIGGGSVIDTAKVANLLSCFPPPDGDTTAYVNAPIGRGLYPTGPGISGPQTPRPLKPHIACPTTAGTGSESTGIAIFDLEHLGVKSGIAHKMLRPTLSLIDPSTQDHIPPAVAAAAGFDVLSHALESYTAIPHTSRATTARTPAERFAMRPMSQGSNPWADHGCLSALSLLGGALVPAFRDPSNLAAKDSLMMASTLAGIAFGNVGVHLPHAMSYAVSGLVRDFSPQSHSWNLSQGSIVPHGMSVILNAPSVFRRTARASPQRHWDAARALGADVAAADPADAAAVGELLSSHLISLMRATSMPNGLAGVGYAESDVAALVAGTMQQRRLLNNLPETMDAAEVAKVFGGAMRYW